MQRSPPRLIRARTLGWRKCIPQVVFRPRRDRQVPLRERGGPGVSPAPKVYRLFAVVLPLTVR